MCNHLFWTLTLFSFAPSSVSLALFCECLKRAPLLFSDIFTRETKIPYRSTCCYHRDNRWYGNRHPLMLLSEGKVAFQMSEELMLQWDSAPPGEKKVSRHSLVWVCLLLVSSTEMFVVVFFFFFYVLRVCIFFACGFRRSCVLSWLCLNKPTTQTHLETRTLWLFKQQTSSTKRSCQLFAGVEVIISWNVEAAACILIELFCIVTVRILSPPFN